MKENINFVNIVKNLLGEEEYEKFLTQVTRENSNGVVSIEEFLDKILSRYCLMILIIGMSKKVEIEKYKIKTDKHIIEIESSKLIKDYKKYIKIIEDKKFEFIKDII